MMAVESRLGSTIYLESPGYQPMPLIRAGSLLPAVGRTGLSTSQEGQPSLDLSLCFGGPPGAEASRPIGQWQVFGLTLLGPKPQVLIQVEVEVSGEVRVSAAHTDKKLDVFLVRSKKPVPVEEARETARDPLSAAREWLALGDRPGAAIELSQVLIHDPDNLAAWEMLATLLVDRDKQIDCYRRILRLDPGHRQARAQLRALTGPPGASALVVEKAAEPEQVEASDTALAAEPAESALEKDLPWEDPAAAADPLGAGLEALEAESEMDRFLRSLEEAEAAQAEVRERQPEVLTPEDVVRLAGDPLPEEKRRRCPQCDAVVSQDDSRCPWCSADLGSESGG